MGQSYYVNFSHKKHYHPDRSNVNKIVSSHAGSTIVGYGINDPVIRYMTDAIAAERRKGDTHFLKPYVFAATNSSARTKNKESWKVKGVEPILYNSGKKHTCLHKTLKRWASYCRDGMRAKERIIRLHSPIGPQPPFESNNNNKGQTTFITTSITTRDRPRFIS